ncbi:MAG: hypothetical protein ACQEP7_04035 [bacterium]
MSESQIWWMLGMVIGALLLGLIVLMTSPDYRFEDNIRSNEDYYTAVEVEAP